jgi:hypothetical protein
MKTFLQFTEDIELMLKVPKNWTLPPSETPFSTYTQKFSKLYTPPKAFGSFDNFDVYDSHENYADDEKRFIVVQRNTGIVAGLVDGYLKRDNFLEINKVELQQGFQGRGSDIMIKTYKLLASRYNLESSKLQSAGGASLWRRLINDPELGGRLFLRDREGRMERLKVGTKEEDIWALAPFDRDSPLPTSKSVPKYSRETTRNRKRVERIYGLSIVIKKL